MVLFVSRGLSNLAPLFQKNKTIKCVVAGSFDNVRRENGNFYKVLQWQDPDNGNLNFYLDNNEILTLLS